ncbi:hypothetical protein AWH62_11350 [Maricaulis sp. W15]|nr:hypothetical protein AWH62_11350 [Maricaulis sp. W15]
MRAFVLTLPGPWPRLLAWALVVLPVLLVGVFAWLSLQQAATGWARRAALSDEVAQLSEGLVTAEMANAQWMRARQLTVEGMAEMSDPTRAREAFGARYGAFLSALEAAGVETGQATGIGESAVTGRVGELHAVWIGVAPVETVFSILEDPQFRPLRVSEMSIIATGAGGEAEFLVEFRQPYVIGRAE